MDEHWDKSLEELFDWWSEVDEEGTSLAGIRALCLIDRYYLLVKVCKRTDMIHNWIYARCREVERDPDGYIDLWSREHYKSSVITFGGVIQRILQDPEITICIFSHTGSIASDFLRNIKYELENNDVLKKAFPDILWEHPEKEASQWSVEGGLTVRRKGNTKEATLESSGLVDGMPTSKHYKLRLYDDIVTDKSVSTPEQIAKTTAAYSLSQALGCEGGVEQMVGTRYSYADTYAWALERKALVPRVHPATENGMQDGALVLFTKDRWKDLLLKSTDSDVACQYLLDPLSGQNRMFHVEDLTPYEVRPESLSVYILVDPARSKKKDSNKTAMIVLGLDLTMNKYLLDGMNHRMDLKERWENLARLYMRWKVTPGVQIVKVGYEAFGAQADMDYFHEQMLLPNRPSFEIVELMWPREGLGSKTDRVQRLVPDCKSHKIFLPYPTDEKRLTKNQLRMKSSGYDYRISAKIRRKDEHGQAYDLTEQLRMQFHFFPFGGDKDAIDAMARIYDMEPRPPVYNQPSYLEPEFN